MENLKASEAKSKFGINSEEETYSFIKDLFKKSQEKTSNYSVYAKKNNIFNHYSVYVSLNQKWWEENNDNKDFFKKYGGKDNFLLNQPIISCLLKDDSFLGFRQDKVLRVEAWKQSYHLNIRKIKDKDLKRKVETLWDEINQFAINFVKTENNRSLKYNAEYFDVTFNGMLKGVLFNPELKEKLDLLTKNENLSLGSPKSEFFSFKEIEKLPLSIFSDNLNSNPKQIVDKFCLILQVIMEHNADYVLNDFLGVKETSSILYEFNWLDKLNPFSTKILEHTNLVFKKTSVKESIVNNSEFLELTEDYYSDLKVYFDYEFLTHNKFLCFKKHRVEFKIHLNDLTKNQKKTIKKFFAKAVENHILDVRILEKQIEQEKLLNLKAQFNSF